MNARKGKLSKWTDEKTLGKGHSGREKGNAGGLKKRLHFNWEEKIKEQSIRPYLAARSAFDGKGRKQEKRIWKELMTLQMPMHEKRING